MGYTRIAGSRRRRKIQLVDIMAFGSAHSSPSRDLSEWATKPRKAGRVLQIVGDGDPGGGTTVVLALTRWLAEQGISVSLASHRNSYIIAEANRFGIETLEFDFSARARSIQHAKDLTRYLRHVGRDVILHAHGGRAALPAALIPKRFRSGMIFTIHGHHYRQKQGILRHLGWRSDRFSIRRSATTVFVSEGDWRIAKEDHLLGPGDRFEVIPNGCPNTGPLMAAPEFDLAYLGRVVTAKNIMILPDILLAMRPARPKLCIIGGGEAEAALRDRVDQFGLSDQVTFFGSLTHEDAMLRLAQTRVLILPSLWEGMPVSVIEAMHHGIPVVCANIPGTRELVTDGETGFLIDDNDVNAFAERLGRLATDHRLYHSMSALALRKARDKFSIDRNFQAHLTLYRRMLGDDVDLVR